MKQFLIIILLVFLFFTYKLNQENNSIRKQNELIEMKYDSLKNENFINYTNTQRYEIAHDKLSELSPRCADMFNEMLEKTE